MDWNSGTDINEATLAKVPAATNADNLGGVAAKPVVHPITAGVGNGDRCAEVPPATGTFCSEMVINASGQTFFQPWRNYGGGFAVAGYYKDAFGIVHLEGLVRDGDYDRADLGDRIFILPAGYRPTATHLFIVTGREESDPLEAHGRVDVASNGDVVLSVRPDNDPKSSSGQLAHLSLDGISFRAA